jgi:SAM-dependent methyltransferase
MAEPEPPAVEPGDEDLDGLDYVLSDSFQTQILGDTVRWDREWLRYLYIHSGYNFYFYDMSTDNYALNSGPKAIAGFTPEEMFSSRLVKDWPTHVWVPGSDLVGKTVLEMGCGPGFFGRMAGRFASSYVGIDMSELALHVARVASPASCSYVHMSDIDALRGLSKSVDTCVSRYFFIHHNYADSLWILRFLRDLTVPGGIITADFFWSPSTVGGNRRHLARDPINPEHASALYHFDEHDIDSIARDAGLDVVSSTANERTESMYTLFRVRQA